MKLNSLELNWIRNYDKSLVIPEVVFSNSEDYGGCYYPAHDDEEFIDGKFYDKHFGIIEISIPNNSNDIEIQSTLAHEWKHHWQYYNGWNNEYCYYPSSWDEDYDQKLYKYFILNHFERDALLFQYKKSKISEHWECVMYNEIIKPCL